MGDSFPAEVPEFLFGGGLGVGTGGVVAALQGAGMSMLGAATVQGLGSDVADKALIFAAAFLVIAALPSRLLSRFPYTQHSAPRRYQRAAPHPRPADASASSH